MEPIYKRYSESKIDENGRLIGFDINCPDNFNFGYDVVDAIANEEPKKQALVYCDENGNERKFTFKEMSDLSSKTANFLIKQGITKGDKVMLILKRNYEYWYVITALHKIGAVAVPATHLLKTEDIVYRVNCIDVKAIVCTGEDRVAQCVYEAKAECKNLDKLFCVREDVDGFTRLDEAIENESASLSRVDTNISEPFLLYFTSGTTGYPKPVTHNHTYPLAHIITAQYWQNVKDNGLHLTVSDTGWGKASWGKIYGQWLCGTAIMVYDYERFNSDEILRVIRQYGVTTFCAPPTVYRFIVKNGFKAEDFKNVSYVTTAGEALNPSIIEQFKEVTGLLIREGFGQTETTLLIGNLANYDVKIGSIGKPSPMYNVKIVNDNGEECKPDETGEIVVITNGERNEGICISRIDNDSEDGRVFIDNIYHTGDLAYADADGYYYYVSRKDDVIKSSGYRIGPFEIENVLMKHESVQECAITGVPDEERGFVVKATIVLVKGYEGSEELKTELKEYVKSHTAPYKYPRIIEFVEELPKTISGKIRRAEIRGDVK